MFPRRDEIFKMVRLFSKGLSNGLSNKVYVVAVKDEIENTNSDVPKKVICRIYGDNFGTRLLAQIRDGNSSRSTENLMFAILGEWKLMPKFHGAFRIERFEEYIEVMTCVTII